MSDWSLTMLLEGLHYDIEQRLATARKAFAHPDSKGDASEHVWLQLLQTYLPQRYQAASAFVVDSNGKFSDQIDVVVFDRQYSPFIFRYEGQTIVPAESIYAVFETKQTISAELVRYAQSKVSSVRCLHRTSLEIPSAGGPLPAKVPQHIFGGLLCFQSEWTPPLGTSLENELGRADKQGKLDIGCVAAHGMFQCDKTGCHVITPQGKPATAFLLELIALLQSSATVPMIDIRAYAKWIAA
jgi:hypothetical protein